MRLARVGSSVLAVGVLAAVVSGCVVFQGAVKVKQKGSKPKAIVTFAICGSDEKASPCPDVGNSEVPPATSDWRLLVGLRFSKGAKAPGFIEPKSADFDGGSGTAATVLDKNPSYTAELKEKAPGSPSKYKWVGYSSEPFDIDDEVGFNSTAKFRIKLELKDKLIGEKLKVRPVVGSYQVSPSQPEDDPIDCGADPFDTPGTPGTLYGDGEFRICIDSPAPGEFTNAKVKIEG